MKKKPSIFSMRLLIHLLLIRPFVKLFLGVNAVGTEHLRDLKQYILIANHNSHLDGLMLLVILPWRDIIKTHPVAAADYFSKHKILFFILDRFFQTIWVWRGERSRDPLEKLKEQLEAGHNIIIFPEGKRGLPGEMERFKFGIGQLAVAFPDIPVVPANITGPERVLPRDTFVPLPLWNEITVGPPQMFTGDRKTITAALQRMVQELSESAAANRHRRKKRPEPPYTVAVLGIDGSGKSTLSRELAQRLSEHASVCLVTDALAFYEQGRRKDVQPFMNEKVRVAVGKYAKAAKSLKHYKIPKLAELLLRDRIMGDVVRWYSPDYIVLDGSPLLNLAAWAKLYKEEHFNAEVCEKGIRLLSGQKNAVAYNDPVLKEFPELQTLRRLRMMHMKLPELVLLLDVDPAVAIERIQRRSETRQVHETEEKLSKLREAYHLVCEVVEHSLGIPTHIQDAEKTIDALIDEALTHINEADAKKVEDG